MENNFIAPPRKIRVVCKNCGNREEFVLDSVKKNLFLSFIYFLPEEKSIRERCKKCNSNKWELDKNIDVFSSKVQY